MEYIETQRLKDLAGFIEIAIFKGDRSFQDVLMVLHNDVLGLRQGSRNFLPESHGYAREQQAQPSRG